MRDSSVDIAVLYTLEQAATPVWALIDVFTTLFAEYENSQDDVASRLKAMRGSYAPSLQLLHRLQGLQRTMHDRIDQFTQSFRRFDSFIARMALNYGLNLLPDDVLSEIFVFAATTLEEKVALSLVCKRFRGVMMSMRKMWDGYWIESRQSPEEIIAIAEGNGFVSLRARILPPFPPSFVKTWVDERGFDLEEYSLRYYKFSVRLILSFGPEELESGDLTASTCEQIEPILASGNMRNLRRLGAPRVRRNSAIERLLDEWHMPLLQILELSFVPGAALAKNLIQCSLLAKGEAQFDSLKEFLAAAKSLQDLQVSLTTDRRFYEIRDLPSIRSLGVNFEPHPSLARHLVRFRLYLSAYRSISLPRLLEFLSSSEVLQELVIYADIRSRGFSQSSGTNNESLVVTMLSVVSFETRCSRMAGYILLAKLRMPFLRTLKLNSRGFGELSTMTRNEVRFSMQSMSSLEELKLNGKVNAGDLDEIIRYAPPHLESLSFYECTKFYLARWNTSPVPQRKLICFTKCIDITGVFIHTFVDYLRAVGLGRTKIWFDSCAGWTNGTFELDDVMSAGVDQEESDVTE